MINVRTPYRISLAGGGTDHPEYFREYGGAVIGFALAQYSNLMVRRLPPYFEHKTRVSWSKIETVRSIEDIEHPAVRMILKMFDIKYGLSITHDGDLPARSGMGSSSSFVVGLLHALYTLEGHERVDKELLAYEAIAVERDMIKETVGYQDQIFAACGGFNQITFGDKVSIRPIYLSPKRIEHFLSHLLLVFTSFQRHASEIEGSKITNIDRNKQLLRHLSEMVPEVEQALYRGDCPDMKAIAECLDSNWQFKKGLCEAVTNTTLDQIYDTALRAGAWGGKLLGAGGGGYFLFVVPPERRRGVLEALNNPIEVPVKIDYHGSRVMMFEPGNR